MTAVLLNRVGRACMSAGQTGQANEYFRQAAEKFRELGDEEQAQMNLDLIEDDTKLTFWNRIRTKWFNSDKKN